MLRRQTALVFLLMFGLLWASVHRAQASGGDQRRLFGIKPLAYISLNAPRAEPISFSVPTKAEQLHVTVAEYVVVNDSPPQEYPSSTAADVVKSRFVNWLPNCTPDLLRRFVGTKERDLTGSFCTRRNVRNRLGKEFSHAEEEV